MYLSGHYLYDWQANKEGSKLCDLLVVNLRKPKTGVHNLGHKRKEPGCSK